MKAEEAKAESEQPKGEGIKAEEQPKTEEAKTEDNKSEEVEQPKAEEQQLTEEQVPTEEASKQTEQGESSEQQGAPIDTDNQGSGQGEEVINPKPIGKGFFGNIYDQFRGKVKAAFDFLLKNKSGDLLGVFHRNDLGDIDLVWGDYNGGLTHMIRRHIVEQNDFANVEELCHVIDEVIKHGVIDEKRSKWDKIALVKDGKVVIIRKNLRDEKGNIINQNKNWVVTSFDDTKTKKSKKKEQSSDATRATPNTDKGSRAVTPDEGSSTDKDTNNPNTKQAENGKDKKNGGRNTAPNVDYEENWKQTPYHNPDVQNHDWSQYKEGDVFDNEGYKYRFEYVSRDENGNVDGVVVREIKEEGSLGVNEKLFPLMFMNDFKKVSNQGKADSGRTESGRVDGNIHQGEEVSEDDYVKNHPDYNAANVRANDAELNWTRKLKKYLRDGYGLEEPTPEMLEKDSYVRECLDHIEQLKRERDEVEDRLRKEYQEQYSDHTKHNLFDDTITESDEVQPLSDEQVSAITEVSDFLGQKLQVVDSAKDKQGRRNNGLYDPNTGTIIISRDTQHPMGLVFGHEATHAVKEMSGGAYDDLHSAVREMMGDEKWKAEVAYKKQLY